MSPLTRTRPALQAFGRQLRAIRREVNISQGELSDRSKVGRQFISEIELGRENPSLETIVLLADGLKCELSDFFPKADSASAGAGSNKREVL